MNSFIGDVKKNTLFGVTSFKVREFTCDSNFTWFPTKFLEMCQSSVLNTELEEDF